MSNITPFLWFENSAEAAANYYVSVFPNSKIGAVSRYGDAGPGPKGEVMVVTFEINGQQFIALNGDADFKFSPAISFMVHCETQEEVDHFWDKLSEGGKEIQCGWLTDKFGVTWQITPTILFELLSDPDPEKSQRVMKVMMGMVKIDIEGLKQAYQGE